MNSKLTEKIAEANGIPVSEVEELIATMRRNACWSWHGPSPSVRQRERLRILSTYLLDDGNTLVAWCTICVAWHTHGAAGRGLDGGGARVAHCDRRSECSYCLEVVGHATPQVVEDMRRNQPRGPRVN